MTPAPIFVGGTGRSGTTVLAKLIASAGQHHAIPIEARFHVDPPGLKGVVAGTRGVEAFIRTMRTHFYQRSGPDGTPRGLHKVLERETLERALERFRAEFPKGRHEAAGELIRGLFRSIAEEAGQHQWIEMTPGNVDVAAFLVRLVPEARFVHIVRNGLDVAASVASMGWGPNTVLDALYWWDDRLRQADMNARMVPTTRQYVVRYDELIAGDSTSELEGLLRFLNLPRNDGLERFFGTMTPEAGHVGRWRHDVPEARQKSLLRHYERLLMDLRSDGVFCLPVADEGYPHRPSSRQRRGLRVKLLRRG